MSNRKTTPDVLGEILGGGAAPATTPASASPTQSAKTKTATRAKSNGANPKPRAAAEKPRAWVYMSVRFREYRGWRPRTVNGAEVEGWKEGPLIDDYLNQVGQDGWELVGIVNNGRSERDAYFKRVAG